MEVAKKFKVAINRRFNEKGGVFWKGLSDEQIATYAMTKVEEFARTGGKSLKASLTIGRQANKKCLDENGHLVDIVPDDNAGQYEEEEYYDTTTYILNEMVQVL
jgi:hypothetical protein